MTTCHPGLFICEEQGLAPPVRPMTTGRQEFQIVVSRPAKSPRRGRRDVSALRTALKSLEKLLVFSLKS